MKCVLSLFVFELGNILCMWENRFEVDWLVWDYNIWIVLMYEIVLFGKECVCSVCFFDKDYFKRISWK